MEFKHFCQHLLKNIKDRKYNKKWQIKVKKKEKVIKNNKLMLNKRNNDKYKNNVQILYINY